MCSCMPARCEYSSYVYLHRQCLQHRALHPDDPLPALNPTIAAYLQPSRAVQTKCAQTVDKLKRSFTLKKVEVKPDATAAGSVFKDE